MSRTRDEIYKCFKVIGQNFVCKNCGTKVKKRFLSNCSTLKQHIATQKCREAGDYTVFLRNKKAAPRQRVLRKIQAAKAEYEAETGQTAVSSDPDTMSSEDEDKEPNAAVASGSAQMLKQEPQQELATAAMGPMSLQDENSREDPDKEKAEEGSSDIKQKDGEFRGLAKVKRTSYVTEEEAIQVAMAMSLSLQEMNTSPLLALNTNSPEGPPPMTPILETLSDAAAPASSASHDQDQSSAQSPKGLTDDESQSESAEPEVGAAFERAEADLEEVTEGLSDILARLQALQK